MALQDHSFQKSQYERPNQNWICGWANEGRSCPIGPRANGSCRASSECFPIKKGDRWFCTRQEPQGGPCQDGPLPNGSCSISIPPCQPILSLRKRRGRASFWTIVLTLGLLFLVLPYPNGSVLISPGHIHSVHGNFGDQCDQCHMVFTDNVIESAVEGQLKIEGTRDSDLCLNCHQFGVNGMRVHNLSPKTLETVSGRLEKIEVTPSPPLALQILNWFPDGLQAPSQSTACGTCHQEHEGKSSNLQAMEDQACQVCHTIQFSGFGDGHPDLQTYPYQRRTRLAFDHNSHIDKHFVKEDKNNEYGSCESCHGLSQTNQTMFTKDFNAACAKCHTQELKGIGNESSLVFFRLPEIDFFTLGENRIGAWPEDLKGELGLEQDWTPFMRVLLETNASSTVPLAQQQLTIVDGDFALLQQHGHLYDLESASPEVLDASERIIWAMKNLLFELSTQGQQAIISRLKEKRITRALGRPLSNTEQSALAAQLPVGVLQTAQQEWFPRLEQEISSRREGNNNFDSAASELLFQSENVSSRKQQNLEGKKSEASGSVFFAQEKDASSRETTIVDTNLEEGFHLERMLEEIAHQAYEDPEGSMLESEKAGIGGDDIFSDEIFEDDILNQLSSEDDADAIDISGTEDNEQELEQEDVDPAEIQERDKQREGAVLTGGWYHSNSDFSIKFRRSGHEDRFSYAWLNLANEVSSFSLSLIEFNVDGTIITASEDFLATLGYSLDDIKGKPHRMLAELAYAESTEYVDFWAQANRGEAVSGQNNFMDKDAKKVWVQGSFKPIVDSTGTPFKVVFVTDMPSGAQLLSHLSNKNGSGSCLRCHSLDRYTEENTQSLRQTINWSSFRPTPHYQSSTHFSHASHFSLVSKEKTCQTCHMRKEIEEKDWTQTWFEKNMNPLEYSSNFKPIPKETCSTCHQRESAGENCLLCHNYHIGQSSVKLVKQSEGRKTPN